MNAERYSAGNLRSNLLFQSRSVLGESHSFVEIIPQADTAEIFSWLNALGPKTRDQIVGGFFSSPNLQIPNSNNVRSYISDIMEISHLSPLWPPEEKKFRKNVMDYQESLGQELLELTVFKGNLQDFERLMYRAITAASPLNLAHEKLRTEMEKAAKESGRKEAFDAVAHIVYQGIYKSAGWAAVPLTYGAMYEVIADKMVNKYPRGNPFKSLMKLYKLGCQPIGAIDGQYYVYLPQRQYQASATKYNPVKWVRELFESAPEIDNSLSILPYKGESPDLYLDQLLSSVKSNHQRAVLLGFYVSELISLTGIQSIAHNRTAKQDQIADIYNRASVDLTHYDLLQLEIVYPSFEALSLSEATIELNEEFTDYWETRLKTARRLLADFVRKNELRRLDSTKERWWYKFYEQLAGQYVAEDQFTEFMKKKNELDPVAGKENLNHLDRLIRIIHDVIINPYIFLDASNTFRRQFEKAEISPFVADYLSKTIQDFFGIDMKLIRKIRQAFFNDNATYQTSSG